MFGREYSIRGGSSGKSDDSLDMLVNHVESPLQRIPRQEH